MKQLYFKKSYIRTLLSLLISFSCSLFGYAQTNVTNKGVGITILDSAKVYIKGSYISEDGASPTARGVIANSGEIYISDSLISNSQNIFEGYTGRVIFNGTGVQYIKGLYTPTFNFVTIDKASSEVKLLVDAAIQKELLFKRGNFNLDTNILKLADGFVANIVGENDSRRIYASTGYVEVSGLLENNTSYIFSNVGLKLSPVGNIPGTITLKRRHMVQPSSGGGSIARSFEFLAPGLADGEAKEAQNIGLTYLDIEIPVAMKDQEGKFDFWRTANQYAVWRRQYGRADSVGNTVTLDSLRLSKKILLTIAEADCKVVPQVELGVDTIYLCTGNKVTLDANMTGYEYNWFKNNVLLTHTSQFITVNEAGLYRVAVTNANGCIGYDSVRVIAAPVPVARLAPNSHQAVCIGQATSFMDSSYIADGSRLRYKWDFGDYHVSSAVNNDTSDLASPSWVYSKPGIYTATLTVTSIYGCSSSINIRVTVLEKPKVNFEATDACAGNAVILKNNSSFDSTSFGNSIKKCVWDFGDNTTQEITSDFSAAISKTYAAPGVYNVKLWVESSGGCRDSITQQVTVYALPRLSINSKGSCISDVFSFSVTDTSRNPSYSISSYAWVFKESNNPSYSDSSSLPSPEIVFTQAGNYEATLTCVTSEGCTVVVSGKFTVYPVPVAAFNANSVCAGAPVQFKNTSTLGTSGSSAMTYRWYFGDGGESTVKEPEHRYSSAGTYDVKLVASGAGGCSDTILQKVSILPNPVAAFEVANMCQGDTLEIQNLSTGGSDYQWILDGEFVSASMNPRIRIDAPGMHDLELLVRNTTGDVTCSSSIKKTVEVFGLPPSQENVVKTVCGSSHVLDANVSNATYVWSTNETTPSITITRSGTYNVRVSTANGCSRSYSYAITFDTPYQPVLGPDTIVCKQVTLSAGVNASAFLWSTGETTQSINVNQSGKYWVKAFSQRNCEGVDSIDVIVETPPVISLGPDTIRSCSNSSVRLSPGNGWASYQWNNGSIASSIQVQHTGEYTVTVKTEAGCESTARVYVEMMPVSEAAFTYSNSCAGNPISFVNQTDATSATSYYWDFGDGSSSTQMNPVKVYNNAGTYAVKLIASTNQCSDTLVKYINIHARPHTLFSVADACVGEAVQIKNKSEANMSGEVSYRWNFGDGTVSTSFEPHKVFSSPGTFKVVLETSNSAGCTSKDSSIITVYAKPELNFSENISTCGSSFVLDAYTTDASYLWSTGSTQSNITVTESGSYWVKVTSPEGCVTEKHTTVTLNRFNKPNLGDDIQACGPVALNAYSPNATYLWSTGETSPNITVEMSGSYWVRVKDQNDCIGFDTISIVRNNPPVVSLGPDITQCGGSVILNAGNPGASYQWSDGSTASTLSVTQSGKYGVVVRNSGGCTASDEIEVTILTEPQPAFTYEYICNSMTVKFSNASQPENGTTYRWDFGDGSTSNAVNPSKTYSTHGNYEVKLTAIVNGCPKTLSKMLSIEQVNRAAFMVNDVCVGDPLKITNSSTGGKGLTYTWNFGDGSSSKEYLPTKVYKSPGTYNITLLVQSETGCYNSIEKTVRVYAKPYIYFGDTLRVCADSLVLDAQNEGSTYLWSDNSTNQKLTVKRSGHYAVHVTNPNGCTSSTSVYVSLSGQVKPDLGPDTTVCKEMILDAGPGSMYDWSTGATTRTIKVTNSGQYWVRVINSNLCAGRDTINVTVQPVPAISLTKNISACANEEVVLDAGAEGVSYSWSTGETTRLLKVTNAGKYKVWVTGSNGCSNVDSTTVAFRSLPPVNLGPDTTVCGGILLSAGSSNGSYLWSDNSTGSQLFVQQSGTYWLRVTASNGCSNTDSIQVVVNQATPLDLGPKRTICSGESVVLDAGEGVSYKWSNRSTSRSIRVFSSGVYQVEVTNEYGCISRASVEVEVVPVPVLALEDNIVLCTGQSRTFHAGGPENTYLWQGPQNFTSTSANITVNASSPGKYWVTATNRLGCASSDTLIVHSSTNVINAVFLAASLVNVGDTVKFVQLSHPDPTHFTWSFGEGGTSRQRDPVYIYYKQGDYKVSLLAGNNTCTDIMEKVISVRPLRRNDVPPAPAVVKDYVAPMLEALIYPNPSAGHFVLELKQEQEGSMSIQIINMQGMVLQTRELETDHYSGLFDISRYPSGLYIVRVVTPNMVKALKVIKL